MTLSAYYNNSCTCLFSPTELCQASIDTLDKEYRTVIAVKHVLLTRSRALITQLPECVFVATVVVVMVLHVGTNHCFILVTASAANAMEGPAILIKRHATIAAGLAYTE